MGGLPWVRNTWHLPCKYPCAQLPGERPWYRVSETAPGAKAGTDGPVTPVHVTLGLRHRRPTPDSIWTVP